MTDIARRSADRLRVMNAIFEAAEGSRMSHVSGGWRCWWNLGLSDEELGGICRYLEGEHLITAGREDWDHHTPFMILLTHAGIEEMERSREAPDQATEHFPPISVIHVEGDAIGSVSRSGALLPGWAHCTTSASGRRHSRQPASPARPSRSPRIPGRPTKPR